MGSSGGYKLKFGAGGGVVGAALEFVDHFQQFAGAELVAAVEAGQLDQAFFDFQIQRRGIADIKTEKNRRRNFIYVLTTWA